MVDNIGFNSDIEGPQYNLAGASRASGEEGVIKDQDRLLPIANVARIMKQILPPNAKVSKEAKETMQECASEFISFVTCEASDKCHKEKRKTVTGEDICWALGTLGLDDYAGAVKMYLHRYRELEGDRANQCKAGNNEEEEPSNIRGESPNKPTVSPTPFKFNLISGKD
ncbi:nuclear transcription factor Y subunit B-4-like [Cornus florida]|uniref:nuclear transcription factor Y subunit B-4-like n=1 Tax=Cornus florida TaxID=4283 RepID=UPI0028A20D4C|nr:nuclear transcription factor Y subunit B-4-like [Cornus florida]